MSACVLACARVCECVHVCAFVCISAQSIIQTVSHSVVQSVSQSVIQSVSQSVRPSVCLSIRPPPPPTPSLSLSRNLHYYVAVFCTNHTVHVNNVVVDAVLLLLTGDGDYDDNGVEMMLIITSRLWCSHYHSMYFDDHLYCSFYDYQERSFPLSRNRLVGLVVRRPPRERKIPGSNPACAGIFPGQSHTSDLKTGTPVATLPGAWRYRVSAGTGRPGVSILWLGEMESLVCNFYLSVAARKIV